MADLRELTLESQVSVRGEPQAGFPIEPNTTARDVLWLGPDEWLVVGGREDDYPEAAAVVDVSANRVCFELTGDDVEEVLAQGCSLDLHPSVFAPGRCAQTLLAKAQVILHRTERETFRIFVRPSFAPYLRGWLEDALTSPRSSLRRR
jgi:sarcosine oxidase subunit gamma